MNPRLKRGVEIWRSEMGALRIGWPWRFITLPERLADLPVDALLGCLDGNRDSSEIAALAGREGEILEPLLSFLTREGLIDDKRTPIPFSLRYDATTRKNREVDDAEVNTSDPALAAFLSKFEIESGAASLLPGNRDGGRTPVLKRRTFPIEIVGAGRIAVSLGGLLLASGFSNTRFSTHLPKSHPSAKVQPRDISGTFFRTSDLDSLKSKTLLELEKHSLFGDYESDPVSPLVIVVGRPAAESLQEWMSNDISHLIIEGLEPGSVRIGPLVIPGKSPCYGCHILWETESQGRRSLTLDDKESVASLTSLVAGVVAADIINFCNDGSSALIASTLTYSLERFISPHTQRLQIHPACGCDWR